MTSPAYADPWTAKSERGGEGALKSVGERPTDRAGSPIHRAHDPPAAIRPVAMAYGIGRCRVAVAHHRLQRRGLSVGAVDLYRAAPRAVHADAGQ